ncbi:MAG: DUF805 domain-containing protein [Sphingomicrobium sp.]
MALANLTPIDWAKRPIEKYADFSGRAPRAEYWWYTLAVLCTAIVVGIVEGIVGLNNMVGPYGPLSLLLMLGLLVPGLAVTVRRLHDTNRSGWWILIAVVPYLIVGVMMGMAASSGSMTGMAELGVFGIVALVGAIVLLVFMVLAGTPGDNQYGPNPYGAT